jgi:DNA-binding NtrC family response regulator
MSLDKTVAISREAEVHELARRVSRDVFMADSIAEASDIIQAHDPDLILFDRRFNPDIDRFLATAENISDAPLVIIGHGDENADAIARFRKMGAYDILRGKADHDRIEEIAAEITSRRPVIAESKAPNSFFANDLAEEISFAGRSEAVKNTLRTINLVANSRCNPVLIVGETGTGKELAAKAVHNVRHKDQPFVAVNCAALTANLLESELFGHVKGAFTGADREKTGLLEIAGAGTLFLDEISEMPMDLQAKLLRVLQEKTFRKVGGVKDIESNATIIASSNRNLKKEAQANRFRQDLYYRLCVAPITLNSLRSPRRRQDIKLLAEYFIKTSSICPDKCDKITSLTKLAVEMLEKYDWPGNVRELRNVIDRAIIFETTDKIGVNSIVIDPSDFDEPSEASAAGAIRNYSLSKAERELIARALQETGWQKTHAAALLGITRATLYAKVKQYNIEKQTIDPCPAACPPARDSGGLGTPPIFAPEPLAVL